MAKNVDEWQHALPWSKVRKGDKDPIEEKDGMGGCCPYACGICVGPYADAGSSLIVGARSPGCSSTLVDLPLLLWPHSRYTRDFCGGLAVGLRLRCQSKD